MPRVYGFDTGFVSFARGWNPQRDDDYGLLWEHWYLSISRQTHRKRRRPSDLDIPRCPQRMLYSILRSERAAA